MSFKFYTLLQTGYHDQNTANIKLGFDSIDEDKNGFITLEELLKFSKSNFDNRQGIQDRLTNALASSHFGTNGKTPGTIILHRDVTAPTFSYSNQG